MSIRVRKCSIFSSSCFALREWANEIVPCALQTCTELKIQMFWQKSAVSFDNLISVLSKGSEIEKREILIFKMRFLPFIFSVVVSMNFIN